MKLVQAVIQPYMLDKVIDALRLRSDISGVTVHEVVGFGRQRGHDTPFEQRVTYGTHGYAKKMKIEIVVPDDAAPEIHGLVVEHAHTGRRGDGVAWVSPAGPLTRIRTGRTVYRASSGEGDPDDER